jgi:hypothetical protein
LLASNSTTTVPIVVSITACFEAICAGVSGVVKEF